MDGMYIICLTSGSGIPVFTRTAGNVKQLPFPVIGSLNAVHMFAANHNSDLKSTSTEDSRIVWKEFHESLVLIAVCSSSNNNNLSLSSVKEDEVYLDHLLTLLWDALVLLHGLEELVNIKNVDRLKKEIRVCNHLLDTLILQEALPVFSDVTGAVEGLLCTEAAVLQNFLEAFVEQAASSTYGCLVVQGRVVVATQRWWDLAPSESILLNLLLLSACPPCSARDLPVYLPKGSPNVPHRLLTFELLRNVEVCVLCGPTPSLAELEKEIARFWVPAFETLKSVRQLYPRCLPHSVHLDNNTLGFLLVNTATNYSVSSVSLKQEVYDETRVRQRRSILRNFYKTAVGSYLSNTISPQSDTDGFSHQPIDTYTVYTNHKCYAHSSDTYQIFLLFSSNIPTFAMRSVCQKLLAQILKDKSLVI